jgi:hypothetical protein
MQPPVNKYQVPALEYVVKAVCAVRIATWEAWDDVAQETFGT